MSKKALYLLHRSTSLAIEIVGPFKTFGDSTTLILLIIAHYTPARKLKAATDCACLKSGTVQLAIRRHSLVSVLHDDAGARVPTRARLDPLDIVQHSRWQSYRKMPDRLTGIV
jgi:hypothetical protein